MLAQIELHNNAEKIGLQVLMLPKKLDKPWHLQVFVTPTCPYCPRAVLLAHQMAMENPEMITAEGVEATEFPELANRFNVRGVPQTVINSGAGSVVGAVPEQNLLAEIMRAIYQETLRRVEAEGCDVFSRVIRLSRFTQARIALGVLGQTRFGRPR